MKRETLTSMLYYTLITIGILTTVILILHIERPDGFFLVNSILERPFFTVDANTSDFHIVVLSILTVASWLVYAVALATCFMFPYTWDIIYDSLYFLYPERNPVDTCTSNGIMPTEVCFNSSAQVVDPDIVFADSDGSVPLKRHYQSTITDLPHVARVISGTEGSNRILYVYNVVTGECDRMSESEFYSKTKKY